MDHAPAFLLSDVSRLMRRRFDERARRLGLTRPQWRALTALSRHEGINQGGLAELIEVEPITLCRMVDRLEEAGMVERRRDPGDRRAWNIFLTDRVRPVLDQIGTLADELFAVAFAGIDEAGQRQLTTLLETIRLNLTDVDDKDTAANG